MDGLPPNPIYLLTQSSFDKDKLHRIKIPLTRNQVKDFNSAYLAPKIWPSAKNRLKSQRSSLMPTVRNPLKMKRYSTNSSLTRTQQKVLSGANLCSSDSKYANTPLIFANKEKSSFSNLRKLSLASGEIKNRMKLTYRLNQEFSSLLKSRSYSNIGMPGADKNF